MPKSISLTPALIALAVGVAGCGSSSTAAGVQLAPSAGATAQAKAASTIAPTPPTPSATSTSTSTTPLPTALKTKPKVVPPAGPAPTKLVIKDLIKGTGPVAAVTSTVSVQYVGVLYKGGKQFDASWDHPGAQPLSLPLSNVIQGWQQGIPGMRVGGRRELIIPSNLGYKAAGRPQGGIPPNAALVFVIDLHGVA